MKIIYPVVQFLMLIGFMLLTGCADTSLVRQETLTEIFPIDKQAVISSALNEQYQNWRAVRYRYGGLTKAGVDCSGFVYLTFLQQFGIKLPRTTYLQAQYGQKISKNKLETGDLVFFKIGKEKRHVGIYLENKQFLHASFSKGVTISSLDNVYWKQKYWKAKRIN